MEILVLKPPQTYDVLPKCRDILDSSLTVAWDQDSGTSEVQILSEYFNMNDELLTNGKVVVTEGDLLEAEEPEAAADGSWWRVVLMPVVNGLGQAQEYQDKVTGYKFRVRCDVNPPQTKRGQTLEDIGFNGSRFLEAMHYLVYSRLHYKSVAFANAALVHSIIRKRRPGRMFRDDQKGFFYMMAEYLTILGPTQ